MDFIKKIISLFALVSLLGGTVSANNYVDSSEKYSSELMEYITEFSPEDFEWVVEDNSVKLLDNTLDFEKSTKDVRNRYNFFALREYQKYNSRLSKSDKEQLKGLIKYFNENYKTYKEKKEFFASLGNKIEKFELAMETKINSLSCAGICKARTRLVKATYGNLLKALKYHNAIVLLRQSTNDVLVNELPKVPMTNEEKIEAERILNIYKKGEVKLIKEILNSTKSLIDNLSELKETGNVQMNLDANIGSKVTALMNLNNYKVENKGLNSKITGDLEFKLEGNGESLNLKTKLNMIAHNLVNYYNLSDLEFSSTDDKINSILGQLKEIFSQGEYVTNNSNYIRLANLDVNSIEKSITNEEYKVIEKRNGHYLVKSGDIEFLLSSNGSQHELKRKREDAEVVVKFDNNQINSIDIKSEFGFITFNQIKGLIMKFDFDNGMEINGSLSKNKNGEYGNFLFRLYKAPDSSSERPLFVTATISDYKLDVNAQIPSYSGKFTYSEEDGYVYSESLDFLARLKLKGNLDNKYELNSLSGDLNIEGNNGEKMFKSDISYSKGYYLRANMNGKIGGDATINGKIDFNYSQGNFDNGLIDIKILDPNNIANKFISDIKMSGGKISGNTYLTSEGKELFKINTVGSYSYNKMSIENNYSVNVPVFNTIMSYTGKLNFSYDNSTVNKLYDMVFDLNQGENKMIDFKLKGDYKREYIKIEPITAPTKVKVMQDIEK